MVWLLSDQLTVVDGLSRKGELEMKNSKNRPLAFVACAVLAASLIHSQPFASYSQTLAKQTRPTRLNGGVGGIVIPQAGGSAVKGTGTAGIISKWLQERSDGGWNMLVAR